MPGHPWLLMLVGHSVAALLTALLLQRGEDWLWSLVELLTRAWRVVRAAAEEPVAAAASGRCPGRATCRRCCPCSSMRSRDAARQSS